MLLKESVGHLCWCDIEKLCWLPMVTQRGQAPWATPGSCHKAQLSNKANALHHSSIAELCLSSFMLTTVSLNLQWEMWCHQIISFGMEYYQLLLHCDTNGDGTTRGLNHTMCCLLHFSSSDANSQIFTQQHFVQQGTIEQIENLAYEAESRATRKKRTAVLTYHHQMGQYLLRQHITIDLVDAHIGLCLHSANNGIVIDGHYLLFDTTFRPIKDFFSFPNSFSQGRNSLMGRFQTVPQDSLFFKWHEMKLNLCNFSHARMEHRHGMHPNCIASIPVLQMLHSATHNDTDHACRSERLASHDMIH